MVDAYWPPFVALPRSASPPFLSLIYRSPTLFSSLPPPPLQSSCPSLTSFSSSIIKALSTSLSSLLTTQQSLQGYYLKSCKILLIGTGFFITTRFKLKKTFSNDIGRFHRMEYNGYHNNSLRNEYSQPWDTNTSSKRADYNLHPQDFQKKSLTEQDIGRKSSYDEDSRIEYDLHLERQLYERRGNVYNDDSRDKFSYDRNLYDRRESIRNNDFQNKLFDRRNEKPGTNDFQDRERLNFNDYDPSDKFLLNQNEKKSYLCDRIEQDFYDNYFRDSSNQNSVNQNANHRGFDDYIFNNCPVQKDLSFRREHSFQDKTEERFRVNFPPNKYLFEKSADNLIFPNEIKQNFRNDDSRYEESLEGDIGNSQDKITRLCDIDQRHFNEQIKQNYDNDYLQERTYINNKTENSLKKNQNQFTPPSLDTKTSFSRKDCPGGTRDPLKRGISGSTAKWYMRFLAEGMEPNEAREKAINRKMNNSEKSSQKTSTVTSEDDKKDIQKFFRKRHRKLREDQDFPTKVTIMSTQHKYKMLTKLELTKIENAIIEEVAKGSWIKPNFKHIHYRAGMLLITCANPQTADWLEIMVPRLPAWKGAPLKVRRDDNLVIEMILPKSAKYTPQKSISLLKAQNEGLHTKEWKICQCENNGEDQLLVLGIDPYSADAIKSQSNILSYKFGTISVTGLNETFEPAIKTKKTQ